MADIIGIRPPLKDKIQVPNIGIDLTHEYLTIRIGIV